jgi:hypothetical protein
MRRCARHSWRSLRSARVPPVDYLDKPPRSSLGATINPGDPILNVKKARSTPGAVAVEVRRARFARFHRISLNNRASVIGIKALLLDQMGRNLEKQWNKERHYTTHVVRGAKAEEAFPEFIARRGRPLS